MSTPAIDAWFFTTFNIHPDQLLKFDFNKMKMDAAPDRELERFEGRYDYYNKLAQPLMKKQEFNDLDLASLQRKLIQAHLLTTLYMKKKQLKEAEAELEVASDRLDELMTYISNHGHHSFGELFSKHMSELPVPLPAPTSLFVGVGTVAGFIKTVSTVSKGAGALYSIGDLVMIGQLAPAYEVIGTILAVTYLEGCVYCLTETMDDLLHGR